MTAAPAAGASARRATPPEARRPGRWPRARLGRTVSCPTTTLCAATTTAPGHDRDDDEPRHALEAGDRQPRHRRQRHQLPHVRAVRRRGRLRADPHRDDAAGRAVDIGPGQRRPQPDTRDRLRHGGAVRRGQRLRIGAHLHRACLGRPVDEPDGFLGRSARRGLPVLRAVRRDRRRRRNRDLDDADDGRLDARRDRRRVHLRGRLRLQHVVRRRQQQRLHRRLDRPCGRRVRVDGGEGAGRGGDLWPRLPVRDAVRRRGLPRPRRQLDQPHRWRRRVEGGQGRREPARRELPLHDAVLRRRHAGRDPALDGPHRPGRELDEHEGRRERLLDRLRVGDGVRGGQRVRHALRTRRGDLEGGPHGAGPGDLGRLLSVTVAVPGRRLRRRPARRARRVRPPPDAARGPSGPRHRHRRAVGAAARRRGLGDRADRLPVRGRRRPDGAVRARRALRHGDRLGARDDLPLPARRRERGRDRPERGRHVRHFRAHRRGLRAAEARRDADADAPTERDAA